jgi:hypothetical protein
LSGARIPKALEQNEREARKNQNETVKKIKMLYKIIVSVYLFTLHISAAEIKYLASDISYVNGVPDTLRGPSSIKSCINYNSPNNLQPAKWKISESLKMKGEPIPTNKWWSSLIWQRCLDIKDALGSNSLFAYPRKHIFLVIL